MQVAASELEKRIVEVLDFVTKSGERVEIVQDDHTVAALIPIGEPAHQHGPGMDHEDHNETGPAWENLDTTDKEIANSTVLRMDR